MDFVKRCRNLSFDKEKNEYFCRSTHVCYRSVCFHDCSTLVKQVGPYIETINLIPEFDFDS